MKDEDNLFTLKPLINV